MFNEITQLLRRTSPTVLQERERVLALARRRAPAALAQAGPGRVDRLLARLLAAWETAAAAGQLAPIRFAAEEGDVALAHGILACAASWPPHEAGDGSAWELALMPVFAHRADAAA